MKNCIHIDIPPTILYLFVILSKFFYKALVKYSIVYAIHNYLDLNILS